MLGWAETSCHLLTASSLLSPPACALSGGCTSVLSPSLLCLASSTRSAEQLKLISGCLQWLWQPWAQSCPSRRRRTWLCQALLQLFACHSCTDVSGEKWSQDNDNEVTWPWLPRLCL